MKESQHARASPPMPTALSPALLTERAKARGEPDWLVEARLEALSSYLSLEPPKWRRTDLSGLDVEALAVRASNSKPTRRAHAKAPGVVHLPLAQAAREHPDLLKSILTTPIPDDDKWARLQRSLWNEGSLLFVEKDVQVEDPIEIDDRHGPDGAVLRDVILIERGANAHIVSRNAGSGPGGLSMESLEVDVRDNASLSLSTLQELDHHATLLANRRVTLRRDARLTWIDGQFGGRTAVSLNETRLVGPGSHLAFLGAFFGSADQHHDITTSALHVGASTSSELNMKGALNESGYAANYSIVNIGEHAKGSSGHQHQETLLLSDKARADAIPKLDVENNDVSASHGATVGQVDPEQVFYLGSRGFSEIAAKRLIVEGFFEPLLVAIPIEDVREQLRKAIVTRLRG